MAALFQSGADEPLTYGFTGNAVTTLQALGLTSGGVALSYAIAADTVTASAPAGNTVFTFQLTAATGAGRSRWLTSSTMRRAMMRTI